MDLKEELINYGFKECDFIENTLIFKLEKGDDRFLHGIFCFVKTGETKLGAFLTNGWRGVSEDRIMNDHNNLNTNSKNALIKFKQEFPEIVISGW